MTSFSLSFNKDYNINSVPTLKESQNFISEFFETNEGNNDNNITNFFDIHDPFYYKEYNSEVVDTHSNNILITSNPLDIAKNSICKLLWGEATFEHKTLIASAMQKSFLNKKRNIETNNIKIENKNKSLGRISDTNKKNNIQGAHTRESPDNIIRGIKSFFITYIRKLINSFIDDNDDKLKQIDYNLYTSNLNKEYNLKILDKSLYEIFASCNLSGNYNCVKYNKSSNDIINYNAKVFEQQKNKKNLKFIKITELTFREHLNIFRCIGSEEIKNKINDEQLYNKLIKEEQGIVAFVKSIYKKKFLTKKAGSEKNILNVKEFEKFEGYIHKIIFYLYYYEEWFKEKNGRKGTKHLKKKDNNIINKEEDNKCNIEIILNNN